MRTVYGAVLLMVGSLSWPLAPASALTLEELARCITVQGNELIVNGCNLHIQNGDPNKHTASMNGLGNLVIGFNEAPAGLTAGERVGSHNLIVGPEHRYLSWGAWWPASVILLVAPTPV